MIALRALAALVLLAAGGFGWYELVESPRTNAFEPVVTHGRGHAVALTFDDGPTRGITDRLLGVLERERVPATFFVVGRAAQREPALLRRMRADGDEIEDHSQSHLHLNVQLAPGALDSQIADAANAIATATGRAPHWLRPPFGARNAAVLDAAARHGMRVVLWSAMLDETSPHAERDALVRRLIAQVGDGAIVVLHDGDQGRDGDGERAYEASLAPLVIAALRAKGYRFLTLDELVGTGPS